VGSSTWLGALTPDRIGQAQLVESGGRPLAGQLQDPVGAHLAALVEIGHGHHPYSPSRAAGGSCQMAADVA
jgi:hypothetical protein